MMQTIWKSLNTHSISPTTKHPLARCHSFMSSMTLVGFTEDNFNQLNTSVRFRISLCIVQFLKNY
jgi:hypothetical protein